MLKRQNKLLLVAGLLTTAVMFLYKPWTLLEKRANVRELAVKGFAYNDTGGKVPGDPRNGEKDLRDIFQWVSIYRQRHGGRYPTYLNDIMSDARQNFKAYGLNSSEEMGERLLNPDNRLGDLTKQKPNGIIAYSMFQTRPDGTPLGGPKKPGEREAIALSSLYVHRNIRNFPGERTTMNPAGVYLVLWEDGSTSRIPYDQVRYAVTRKAGFSNNSAHESSHSRLGFPGQAGIPDNALSYDEYYRTVLHGRAPRGTPGGPGVPLASK